MHIFHIATECAPLLQYGGLAQAVRGLAKAQYALKKRVSLWLPPTKELLSFLGTGCTARTWEGITLCTDPTLAPTFCEHLYQSSIPSFVRWAQLGVSYAEKNGATIIHGHDWPAACAMRTTLPTLFTVHNGAHQGKDGAKNWLAYALENASILSTVSPSYRKALLRGTGHGLAALYQQRQKQFFGILNGLEEELWPVPYTTPAAKASYHHALCAELNLPPYPLAITIARMDPQKGLESLYALIDTLNDYPLNLILMGCASTEKIATTLKNYKHPRFRYYPYYEQQFAQRLYAAAAYYLMPSKFEPCGLSQLIANRYGTLCIARKTGGLQDSLIDWRAANGFSWLYEQDTPEAFLQTLQQAIDTPIAKKNHFQNIAMKKEASWYYAAQSYLHCYQLASASASQR